MDRRSFCHQTWYGYATSWARVSCRKIGSLSSMPRSQRGLIQLKYDYFYYIFQIACLFATKLGLVVKHHKPECPVEKKWITEFKVKVTAMFKMSVNVFPDDIFWTAKHFVSKLGMVVQQHKLECRAEFLFFGGFLLSSKSRSQRGLTWSKYESFYYIFWTVNSSAKKLSLMRHHHKPECLVKKWITAFKVKVTAKGQNVNVCPNNIF